MMERTQLVRCVSCGGTRHAVIGHDSGPCGQCGGQMEAVKVVVPPARKHFLDEAKEREF
jgi:hypothetical protein